MRHPIGQQKCFFLREVAVIEHKQELATIALESLNRVRNAGREIPKIALADIVLEGATILINRSDPRLALEHVGPLGRLMPMHLSYPAGLEAHVDTGKLRSGRQFADCRLPAPTAWRQMHVAVGKRPSQISKCAVVR